MKSVLVLAGPSAVGKTTVAKNILSVDARFELIRSATTRQARGDGNDGEYLYFTREEFLSMLGTGDMLESTEYGGNLYGTPRLEIERVHSEGKIPLLILDIRGVCTVKSQKHDFACISVYIWDTLDVMAKRLALRYKDSDDGKARLEGRLKENLSDYRGILQSADFFDAFVKNDGIESAGAKILEEFERMTGGGERESDAIQSIAEQLYESAK